MEHVKAARQSGIDDFEIRYERIDETYNKIDSNINITSDEFHYAYAVVFTRYIGYGRAFNTPVWFDGGDGCGALAPVFDLYNHNWYATVDWFTDDGGMLMKTNEKIEKGDELFNSYGDG